MKRITVLVSGKVQEVGYRERVVTIAKVFMLTGMVQNLIDGRVKVVAEGEEDKLKLFIGAINIKNTMIFVENMDITYSNVTGDYNDFYKLVGVGETDSRLDTASKYLKELIDVVSPQTDYLKKLIEITQQGFNGINSKIDIMIDKQDQMLDKQDIMIEQQTENTNILKEFKEESNRKQDIMIEKQNETISAIQNESKLIQKEIGGEIRLFNVDSRDHMELNYRDIKEETKEIKEDIKDVKEEIENIKISLKK